MLWAKGQGKRQFRAYHDQVFERFWQRELDIEDPASIAAVLSDVDADMTGFSNYLAGEGRIEHDTSRESAEAAGVFGVPSLIVEGELYWGREHLADIREKLSRLLLETTVFGQRRPAREIYLFPVEFIGQWDLSDVASVLILRLHRLGDGAVSHQRRPVPSSFASWSITSGAFWCHYRLRGRHDILPD